MATDLFLEMAELPAIREPRNRTIGHPRFTGRWCPNLYLVKISLSLSRALRIHTDSCIFLKLKCLSVGQSMKLIVLLFLPAEVRN